MGNINSQAIIQEIRHIKEVESCPPLRVAAYCRVSSDSEDQLNSYAAQIHHYTEYIGQNPEWVLADIYADEGLTGTKTEKREDLKRLLNDCRKGKIDRILVKTVSRFARNTTDCLSMVKILKEYGVTIYFEEHQIDTAQHYDELMLTMNGMAAQGESMTISNNMRWSYKRRMEKGEFVGCTAAFGYRLVKGTLEIYEPEAKIVLRIFDMYLSGIGRHTIANILNDEGVLRRQGKNKWLAETINYILSNERYIGDALLQKTYTTDFPFRNIINKGEKPKYYVENSHPQIVSKETFDAVQKLKLSRQPSPQSGIRHLLSGKLRCPDCGHTFRKQIINGISYWACSYKTSGATKSCRNIRYTEESVYDIFTMLVNKMVLNREYILAPMISQLERMQNRNSAAQNKIYEIDRQIAELNQQNIVYAQHRSKGFIDAAGYAEMVGSVNQKVSALRAKRRSILAEDENDEMIDELKWLNATLAGIECIQISIDKELFKHIVVDIIAESDKTLRFRLTGGLELSESILLRKER